jgi:hypothetical protein
LLRPTGGQDYFNHVVVPSPVVTHVPACGADDDSASDDDEKGGRNPNGSAPPPPLPSPTKRSGTPWFELPPLPEMDISDAEKMELVSYLHNLQHRMSHDDGNPLQSGGMACQAPGAGACAFSMCAMTRQQCYHAGTAHE